MIELASLSGPTSRRHALSAAWSMRRTPVILALTVAAVLLLLSCNKPQKASSSNITIDHEITPQPPRVGSVTIKLKLAGASLQPLSGAHISLEGNMSHAGMAPSFGEAKELTPGQYQGPLQLTMAGDWIVIVHVTLPNGEKLERQFDIKGVRPD